MIAHARTPEELAERTRGAEELHGPVGRYGTAEHEVVMLNLHHS